MSFRFIFCPCSETGTVRDFEGMGTACPLASSASLACASAQLRQQLAFQALQCLQMRCLASSGSRPSFALGWLPRQHSLRSSAVASRITGPSKLGTFAAALPFAGTWVVAAPSFAASVKESTHLSRQLEPSSLGSSLEAASWTGLEHLVLRTFEEAPSSELLVAASSELLQPLFWVSLRVPSFQLLLSLQLLSWFSLLLQVWLQLQQRPWLFSPSPPILFEP